MDRIQRRCHRIIYDESDNDCNYSLFPPLDYCRSIIGFKLFFTLVGDISLPVHHLAPSGWSCWVNLASRYRPEIKQFHRRNSKTCKQWLSVAVSNICFIVGQHHALVLVSLFSFLIVLCCNYFSFVNFTLFILEVLWIIIIIFYSF